jgi:hypothetical protein
MRHLIFMTFSAGQLTNKKLKLKRQKESAMEIFRVQVIPP